MLKYNEFRFRAEEWSKRGVSSVKNKLFGFAYAINYIMQAAWSFVFSAALVIVPGYFISRWLAVGTWLWVVFIVLGVLCGVYSMFLYIIRMADYATGDFDPEKRSRRKRRK